MGSQSAGGPAWGGGNHESVDRAVFCSLQPSLFHLYFYFSCRSCVLCPQAALMTCSNHPARVPPQTPCSLLRPRVHIAL